MSAWIDVKYIRFLGAQLTLFKEKRQNLWNFRCPICGDSTSDATKCRGYIYLYNNDYMYKCQRCGDSRPFKSLLYIVSPELYKQHKMEVFKDSSGGKTRKTNNGTTQKPKFSTRRNKFKIQEFEIPKLLDGFEPISMLPEDHFMVEYVKGRMIPKKRWNGLFWASNMRKIADQIPGYSGTYFDNYARLLLPFINRDGVMTHIQGRAVGDDVPKGSRYYTLEVESEPKVYGLDQLDESSRVHVVEGPIDSLFISNCVGMGGADVPWDIFDPTNTTFVWDNEPRSSNIIKRMKEPVRRGFGVCIWGDKIREKDINDMVLSGHTPDWIQRYITDHSVYGLRAKLAITQYEK